MAVSLRPELVSAAQARERLAQLGAAYDRDSSQRAQRHVYYSGRNKVFVTLTKEKSDLYRLDFSRSCPCGG